MSDELKPCPHCGNTDNVEVMPVWYTSVGDNYNVVCNWNTGGCGAMGGARRTEAEAIAAWNTRADDAPINEKHVPSLKESTEDTQVFTDSRERLEADVRESYETGMPIKAKVLDWLDRQASITERELCDRCSPYATAKDYLDTIDSLTAERDELQSIIDHMPKTEQECEACQDAHDRLMFNAKVDMDELRAECDRLREKMRWTDSMNNKLREKLDEKQHVCDVQRDSFLKLERENRELQDVCGELERTVENMRGVE